MNSGLVGRVLDRVERTAVHRVRVTFAGHAFVLSTNAVTQVNWLRDYTAGQYQVSEAPPEAEAQVSSIEDSAFEAELRAELESFPRTAVTLYQEYPAEEIELGDGWIAWVHTSRRSVILCAPGRRCVTVGVREDVEVKSEPVRCLREMFTKTIERDGHLVFHAGAVAIGQYGVAICGARGAGKSTTVISLVEAGASFLSNDRSYIDGSSIHPWPTTAAIGMGTLYHFPGLRSWMERGSGWVYEPQARLTDKARHDYLRTLTPAQLAALPDKLELTSAELAHSLGSEVVPTAPLSCLLFPRIDLDRQDVTLEHTPAQEAADLLLSQSFAPPNDRGSDYPDWLRWRTAPEDQLTLAAHELVKRLVDEIPCVTLRFGDLRGDAGRRALDGIVGLIG